MNLLVCTMHSSVIVGFIFSPHHFFSPPLGEEYVVALINVTVHAKTSLVRTKIEIHFLPQLIVATCTACLPWPDSTSLLFWGVDLQPCKTMTDTLAPVEHANLV